MANDENINKLDESIKSLNKSITSLTASLTKNTDVQKENIKASLKSEDVKKRELDALSSFKEALQRGMSSRKGDYKKIDAVFKEAEVTFEKLRKAGDAAVAKNNANVSDRGGLASYQQAYTSIIKEEIIEPLKKVLKDTSILDTNKGEYSGRNYYNNTFGVSKSAAVDAGVHIAKKTSGYSAISDKEILYKEKAVYLKEQQRSRKLDNDISDLKEEQIKELKSQSKAVEKATENLGQYASQLDIVTKELNKMQRFTNKTADLLKSYNASVRKSIKSSKSLNKNVTSPVQTQGVIVNNEKDSSVKVQKEKNAKREEQKGFLSLLIPALAKLMHKTPIWDAIKLLLLKYGANHPIATATALTIGPAALGAGALLGKGLFKQLANRRMTAGAAKEAARKAAVSGKPINKVAEPVFNRPYGATDGLGKINSFFNRIQTNRRALQLSESFKLKRDNIKASFKKWYPNQEVPSLSKMEKQFRMQYARFADPYSAKNLKDIMQAKEYDRASRRAKLVGYRADPTRVLRKEITTGIRDIKGIFKKTSTQFIEGSKKFFTASLPDKFKGLKETIAKTKITPASVKEFTVSKSLGLAKNATKGTYLLGAGAAKGVKALGPAGTALAALFEIPALLKAGKEGKLGQQLSKSGGGVAGAVIGGGLGSALGPIGTMVGAIIGDIIGRVVGPALFDGFKVFGGKLSKDFGGIWKGLKDTFSGLMRAFTVIGKLLGRLLVPSFKVLGTIIGGVIKSILWGINVLAKVVGWTAKTLGDLFEGIYKGLSWLGEQIGKIPFLGDALKKFFSTSADDEGASTVGNAEGAAVNSVKDTSSKDSTATQKSGATYGNGTTNSLGMPNSIGRKLTHQDAMRMNTVDMRQMGLYGSIDSGNSVPFVAAQNANRLRSLDKTLADWGYHATYTSAMGGHTAGGHIKGNKVDLQLTKDGRSVQLTPEQYRKLASLGYFGGKTGAVGWEAHQNQVGGGHYDLYIGDKTGTKGATSIARNTTDSAGVLQVTEDGIRTALAERAGDLRDKNSTRALMFAATDVTGSLGVWGITQLNNSGRHR